MANTGKQRVLATEAWAQVLFDRRRFLVGASAAGAALLLPQCAPAVAPPPGATALEYFAQLRSLRELVRASPDHLSARAAEVVASGDFTRAVRFVRDNVGVLPPPNGETADDGVRWGPAATLRAGAGTMRERADLLAALLQAMGATVKVRAAATPDTLTAAELYRAAAPAFSASPSRLAALAKGDAAAPLAKLSGPPGDVDPSSVVAALLATLPSDTAVVRNAFDGLGGAVPVVEYTAQGVTRWAYALGALDEVSTEPSALRSQLTPSTFSPVKVRLLGYFTPLPGVPGDAAAPVELVAGAWTMDQVAGRRLSVSFPPPGDPAASFGAPPESLPVRVPTLALQPGPSSEGGASPLWQPPASVQPTPGFQGAPVTLSGARFTPPASEGAAPSGPYGGLVLLDDTARAAARAKVVKLEAVATGGAFPDVQVAVAALDAAGAPVAGLQAEDFTLRDEAKAQGVSLMSNAPTQQLRVLLAYDCSGSVTGSFPTPAARAAFEEKLANALVASAALTGFEVAVSPLGVAPTQFAPPDRATIGAALTSCSSSSEVWAALGDVALRAAVAAVVVVSDFDASDDPATIPALRAKLASSGLPVALVPVGKVVQPTVDELVRLASATSIDPSAADFEGALASFLSTTTARVQAACYRLRYRVPDEEQGSQSSRLASVSLVGTSRAAEARYLVPALADRSAAGLSGLYLELTVAGITVTRCLSGPGVDRSGARVRAPVALDFTSTRELLSGLTTVAFEPGSPTTGANLDDFYSGLLSLEPISKHVGKPFAQSVEAAAPGFRLCAGTLTAMVDRPDRRASGAVVAPKGLRVVVMTESVSARGLSRRVDVVPELNLAVAATRDPAQAFAANLAATVALNLREKSVAAISAAGNLASAKLQYLSPFITPRSLQGFSETELAAWDPVLQRYRAWHRLVPTTPAPGALWAVDPDTGAAVAVFLDGSGGGDCSKSKWNAGIQGALALVGFYASVRGATCDLTTVPGEYVCLGAYVGGVAAGGAGLLAGLLLDEASFLDYVAVLLTAAELPGVLGGLLGAAAVNLTLYEALESIRQNC